MGGGTKFHKWVLFGITLRTEGGEIHSSTACNSQDKAGPQLGLYNGWKGTYGHKSLGVPLN